MNRERQFGICQNCKKKSLFQGLYAVGWRAGALSQVVKDYKYRGVRAAADVLVDLLDGRIPEEGFETGMVVVVPLPTIGRHVRERGLDHTLVLAKKLARRRGWKMQQVLTRVTNTVQVGASEEKRREQAKTTYCASGKVDPKVIYLLLDDVWTTGASMMAAAEVLRKAGARRVYGAILEVGRPSDEAVAN